MEGQRRLVRVAVLATVVSAATLRAAASHEQSADVRATDDAAVRTLIAAYVDARERRDAVAIGALFTADADQVNSSGDWRRGRDGIVRGTLESSQRNSGARRVTVKAVRFPAPGVAIVDGDYEIGASGPGAARQMWTTFVLIKRPDGWKISAIRNSRPTP